MVFLCYGNFNFEIKLGGGGGGEGVGGRGVSQTRLGAGATYTNMTFSAPGISLCLFYSRERKLLLLLEKEKKGEVESGKSHHNLMYTRLSRVKLCAVRMRNAIQRDNLNETCCLSLPTFYAQVLMKLEPYPLTSLIFTPNTAELCKRRRFD